MARTGKKAHEIAQEIHDGLVKQAESAVLGHVATDRAALSLVGMKYKATDGSVWEIHSAQIDIDKDGGCSISAQVRPVQPWVHMTIKVEDAFPFPEKVVDKAGVWS